MYISIETSDPIDALARKILQLVLEESGEPTGNEVMQADAKAAQAKADETPAPTRRKRRTKAEIEAERKAAEPDEDDEAEVASDDEDDDLVGDAPTKEDAIARVRFLVQNGKGAAVRKALKTVGVNKAGELDDEDDIRAFMDAVAKL